tara:strand:- start:446 stop:964 length:519 start_codon:yes stop_codon:yes gene_type:complete
MSRVLFVSAAYVKRKSFIGGQVDPDEMIHCIETSQDMQIQNYLGTRLYKKIQSLIADETINDSENADYKFLLETHIQPMLCWYSQSEYIPWAAYKLGRKGIYKGVPEGADSITSEEIANLANRANNKANFYTERFLEYMCEQGNSNKYPEYTSTTEGMSPDKDVNGYGGFVL